MSLAKSIDVIVVPGLISEPYLRELERGIERAGGGVRVTRTTAIADSDQSLTLNLPLKKTTMFFLDGPIPEAYLSAVTSYLGSQCLSDVYHAIDSMNPVQVARIEEPQIASHDDSKAMDASSC